jgi:hypothetical protein
MVSHGIQFFVFPEKIIVHLVICGFEIIDIGLVGCWSWELHMSSCSKRPDTEPPFAGRHKRRKNITVGFRHIKSQN